MNAFSDFTDVIKKLITELKVFGEHLFQLRKSINQHIEAMRQHQKRNPQQSNIDPLEFEKIIAKYEPPIRDKSKNDDRNYRVQRLIMIATWCAFFAALIYASLAWMQWNAAKTANDISLNAQRAWINVRVDNIEVMNGEFPHGASITFGLKVAVTFQNFGHSPALHLWPSFGNFSDIGPQKEIFTPLCKDSETISDDPHRVTETVFPSADIQRSYPIQNAGANRHSTGPHNIQGCIAYRSSNQPTIFHHTWIRFRFQSHSVDDGKTIKVFADTPTSKDITVDPID